MIKHVLISAASGAGDTPKPSRKSRSSWQRSNEFHFSAQPLETMRKLFIWPTHMKVHQNLFYFLVEHSYAKHKRSLRVWYFRTNVLAGQKGSSNTPEIEISHSCWNMFDSLTTNSPGLRFNCQVDVQVAVAKCCKHQHWLIAYILQNGCISPILWNICSELGTQ